MTLYVHLIRCFVWGAIRPQTPHNETLVLNLGLLKLIVMTVLSNMSQNIQKEFALPLRNYSSKQILVQRGNKVFLNYQSLVIGVWRSLRTQAASLCILEIHLKTYYQNCRGLGGVCTPPTGFGVGDPMKNKISALSFLSNTEHRNKRK